MVDPPMTWRCLLTQTAPNNLQTTEYSCKKGISNTIIVWICIVNYTVACLKFETSDQEEYSSDHRYHLHKQNAKIGVGDVF